MKEDETDIVVGSIVTVLYRNCQLCGKQGQVFAIDENKKSDPVVVLFNKRDILGMYDSEMVSFDFVDLRKELTWSIDNRINLYWSHSWHQSFALKYLFSKDNDCMYKACPNHVCQRIVYNYWGSIYEMDVCDEHASCNGYMIETEPPYKECYRTKK